MSRTRYRFGDEHFPHFMTNTTVAWLPLRRGYVDDPLHWRYSSARSYANGVGLIDVCVDWM